MEMKSIRIGQRYYCLLKTTVVDETQLENMEFIYHVSCGVVKVKGLMQDPAQLDHLLPFVEITGQRVRASHVFETHEECMEFAASESKKKQVALINDFHRGGEPIPQ